MNRQEAINKIKTFPDTPGVYLFRRAKLGKNKDGGEILYIGKATSLRDRVRSYFNANIVSTRSPLIAKMLTEFDTIEYMKTDSVLEALVLEAYLIKKYQPEANIKEKDNRSFNFVVITDEEFPRVLIVRGRELLHTHEIYEKDSKREFKISYSFGPFPNGSQLKEAMKIVRKLFPFRDTCLPCVALAKQGLPCKPCFNSQIGLCPGVCTGQIDATEYRKIIQNIILFFEGNKEGLLRSLKEQMDAYAINQQFEKASKIKRTLFSLNHIQDIALIKKDLFESADEADQNFRIESYDIAHLSGTHVVGVMTVVEGGEKKLSDYRKFKIKENPGVNDTKALSEVLSRRLAHIEWRMPDLIVVDGGTAQKNAMQKILKQNGVRIPVVSVVKDERHRPREILGDKKWLVHESAIILSNQEAHRFAINFHKKLRGKMF